MMKAFVKRTIPSLLCMQFIPSSYSRAGYIIAIDAAHVASSTLWPVLLQNGISWYYSS